MYVCSQLEQYRKQFDSKSDARTKHTVTWNHHVSDLVCSCQGYTNHDHCWHIQDARKEAACLWSGTRPIDKHGILVCPICGSKVYEVREYDSRDIEERVIDVESSLVVRGDIVIIVRDQDVFTLNKKTQQNKILPLLFEDVSALTDGVPKMKTEDAIALAETLLSVL